MPAIGKVKAARLKAHLELLLPPMARTALVAPTALAQELPALSTGLPPGANCAEAMAAGIEAYTDA